MEPEECVKKIKDIAVNQIDKDRENDPVGGFVLWDRMVHIREIIREYEHKNN